MEKEELKTLIVQEGDIRLWSEDGLYALALRIEKLGHLCGYVGVNAAHPLYGKSYCDEHSDWLNGIEVHGGLTYSGLHDWFHLTEHEKPIWWFGFDCCAIHEGEYRDMSYVISEVKKLIKQLKQ